MRAGAVRTTILVVEDNTGDVRLLREMFNDVGSINATLVHVETLGDAELRLREGGVDIILLDLGLPDAQGLDAVRRIHAAAPRVPIVVLTGLDDESVAAHALQQGARDYLIKGQIDGRSLLRAIRYAFERKEMDDALFAEKERAQVTLQSIGDAVVCTNADAEITFLNVVAERLTGWRNAEAMGQPIQEVLRFFDVASGLPAENPMTLAGCVNPEAQGQPSWVLIRRDGVETPIEQCAAPIHDSAGNATGAVIVFHDVSATRAMALLLRESLEEANRARGIADHEARQRTVFLDEMSHELRNPLNVLLGMAEALEDTELSALQRTYIDVFQREGERMLALINDLLDVSKIDSGHYEVFAEDFNLRSLLEEVLSFVGSRDRKTGVTLHLDCADGLPGDVRSDPVAVRRILMNLLTNALKFTESGSVTLSARREGEALLLEVRDTGAGIPEEKLQTIFERFRQQEGRDDRRRGGSGLGLNIVRSLTEAMEGSVTARSKPGAGSTFTVTIPYRPAEHPQQVVQETIEASSVWEKPLRILIGEDSAANRFVYEAFLHGLPFSVLFAENGREAVEAFRDSSFDLVLMDVQMPEMDGYEATSEIRKWEEAGGKQRTPVISVSAHAFPADVQAALDAGCDGHLAKPFRKKGLLRTIERAVLGTSEITAANEELEVPAELVALLDDYLQRALESVELMRQASAKGDLAAIREESHRLRGTAGSYGLAGVTHVAGRVEDTAANGDSEGSEAHVAELRALIENLQLHYGGPMRSRTARSSSAGEDGLVRIRASLVPSMEARISASGIEE